MMFRPLVMVRVMVGVCRVLSENPTMVQEADSADRPGSDVDVVDAIAAGHQLCPYRALGARSNKECSIRRKHPRVSEGSRLPDSAIRCSS